MVERSFPGVVWQEGEELAIYIYNYIYIYIYSFKLNRFLYQYGISGYVQMIMARCGVMGR